MISNQDLARLETELRTEDLNSLKRRRTDNRRDASRNELFYKDCVALSPDELDIGSIKHHLDKINTSIAIAELLQNAILARLKWRDEEKEETSITVTIARCWPCEKDYYNSSLQLMYIDRVIWLKYL